jgi:hypothetical protein
MHPNHFGWPIFASMPYYGTGNFCSFHQEQRNCAREQHAAQDLEAQMYQAMQSNIISDDLL